MQTLEAKIAEYNKRFKKTHSGFTEEEFKAFHEEERRRIKEGATPLYELDIPMRAYHAFVRSAGALTVEGAMLILDEGRKPRQLGTKLTSIVERAIIRHYQHQDGNLN